MKAGYDDTTGGDIFTSMMRIQRLFREIMERELAKRSSGDWLGSLTGRQTQMVVTVKEIGSVRPEGVSLNELAALMGVTAPSASAMVDTLVQLGFLVRESCPSDRRAIRITLSPSTAKRFKIGDRAMTDAMRHLSDRFGEKLMTQWRTILEKVGHELEDMISESAKKQV